MKTFKTTFYDYSTGVEFTMSWPDEMQYRKGKAFLDKLTAGIMTSQHPDRPDFYILETEQQYMALIEFRKRLQEERQ